MSRHATESSPKAAGMIPAALLLPCGNTCRDIALN